MNNSNSNDTDASEDVGDRITSPTPEDLLNHILSRSDASEVDVLRWQMGEMARQHERELAPESFDATLELLGKLAARAEKQNQDPHLASGLELIARTASELLARRRELDSNSKQASSAVEPPEAKRS